MFNNIQVNINSGMLVLLDLSALFDTVDHDIIFERLENWVGSSVKVFAWSYLNNKEFFSSLGNFSP